MFTNVDQHKILKHVECRWLTLEPAISRILEQWHVILQYFVIDLPKLDPKVCSNARYLRIIRMVNSSASNHTLTELYFLKCASHIFTGFLTLFQKEEPLVHLLYEHMDLLVKRLLSRIILKEVIEENGNNYSDIQLNDRKVQLSDEEVEIGEHARKCISRMTPFLAKETMISIRKFYSASLKYLIKKLPLDNVIIKNSRCLHPQNRCAPWALSSIRSLACALPISITTDVVADEWKALQSEDIPNKWYELQENEEPYPKRLRVDHYWLKVFAISNSAGEPKYSNLGKVVKCALLVAHGNADPERGFSQSIKSVTDLRVKLSEASVDAIQSTKDGLKFFNGSPHLVPITKDFLQKGRRAHASYMIRVEEEKKKAEEERKKREHDRLEAKKHKEGEAARKELEKQKRSSVISLIDQEKHLALKETLVKEDLNASSSLLDDANKRIIEGIKKKNMQDIRIGQTMLEAAKNKIKAKTTEVANIREEQKAVEREKRTMLDYFSKKSTKKLKLVP